MSSFSSGIWMRHLSRRLPSPRTKSIMNRALVRAFGGQSNCISRTVSLLQPPVISGLPSQAVRNFSKKDRRKGSANAGGSGSGSGTAAPSRHTAPHHHHAPSIGGVTHNEQPLVDLDKLQSKMERVLRGLEKEFSGVRGGRPDAGMFDHLHVQAYGKATPLSDVAQVTIKSPTLAVIHVYDPDILHPVHEAVQASKLELNPRVDGNVVNVPLPKPSAEMRQGYVKLVSQCTETARQNLRKIRREGMDRLKGEGKEGVGEDDVRRSSKLIESMTEEWVKRVGEALEKKKKEIMTV